MRIVGLFSWYIVVFLAYTASQAQDFWSNVRIVKTPFSKPVTCLVKDHTGFLWLGTPQGLYRYDGYAFSLINTLPDNGLQLSDPQVNSMLEDAHQNLWVATDNGVTVISPGRDQFLHLAVAADSSGIFQNKVTAMVESGRFVWFGTQLGYVYQVPTVQAGIAFTQHQPLRLQKMALVNEPTIKTLVATENGAIWACYQNELVKIDARRVIRQQVHLPEGMSAFHFIPGEKKVYAASPRGILSFDPSKGQPDYLYRFSTPSYIQESRRRKYILPDPAGDLWVYGFGGIFGKFDLSTASFRDLAPRFENFSSEAFTNFNALCLDQHQHGWIGRTDGLFEIAPRESLLKLLPMPVSSDKLGTFGIRSIQALPDSSLLVSSYVGLFQYIPRTSTFKPVIFRPNPGEPPQNPLAYDFYRWGDTVYIASESFGLLFYRVSTGKIHSLMTRQEYDNLGPERAIGQWALSVLRDHAGTVWTGTYGGLMYWKQPDTLAAFRIKGRKLLSKSWVYDIQEDRNHRLWLATSSGLYSLPPTRNRLESHPVAEVKKVAILAMLFNPDGSMWLATHGEGIKWYNPATEAVKTYTMQEGLPDNGVVSIQPDAQGNLWLGTYYGLCYFNPKANSFINYFQEDGLPGNECQHNAAGQDLAGTIYIGLSNGMVAVGDKVATPRLQTPQPIITNITQHDGADNQTHTHLFNSFQRTNIELGYQDTYFSVHFSVKEFTGEKPQFSYQLDGVSPKWNYLGEQNSLQFAALPPGKYQLRIRARLGKSDWSEQPLIISITVARAFYQTWWAYLVYSLLLVMVGYTGLRLYWNRLQLRRQWQSEREHAARLLELDEVKTRFFTNMAHELRTPLTLIKGPIGKIRQLTGEKRIQGLVHQVERQAEAMLHLVNQLLELSRIESGAEKLRVVHTDIVQSLRIVTEAYRTYALEQEVDFTFVPDKDAFPMDFDPDKLEKILRNLLSNAFKFTPRGGQVSLYLQTDAPERLTITLSDTGIGISPEALPQIFDRFYQADSSVTRRYGGTGIGLSYVKELIALHQGTIEVESQPGKGTHFRISLPVQQPESLRKKESSALISPSPAGEYFALADKPAVEPAPAQEGTSTMPVVLLIEDHPELAGFVADCLAGHYQVQCAFDGAEGYHLAIQNVPDLIITDLMLPKMDGLTLARQLKAHELTSHIPLVMLTARATDVERMRGLEGGADAYLTKPFLVEELTLTVHNLLQLRNSIVQKFIQLYQARAEKALPELRGGQSFLERFTQVAEANLADENFGVNELLRELGMSRTQLHRKLKATTGQSTLDLLRSIRMQKALLLLQTTTLPVAEVAERVGYGSASHFTKIFGEHFGFLPSTSREKADTP